MLILTGLVALLLAVYIWSAHPNIGVSVVLMVMALTAVFGPTRGVTVLGFQIYFEDIIWTSALASLAFRKKSRRSDTITRLTAAALLLGVGLLAIGSTRYGAGTAGAEFRTFFYFLAAIIYGLSDDRVTSGVSNLFKAWVWIAGLLAVYCLGYWAIHGVGIGAGAVHPLPAWGPFAGGFRDSRPIRAVDAIFLIQAFLIIWRWPDPLGMPKFLRGALRLVLPAVVILLQHRTAWVALLLAVVALVVFDKGTVARARTLAVAATSGIVLLVGVGFANLAGSTATAGLETSLAETQSPDSTFAWRLSSWNALLTQSRDPMSWLFGEPLGGGYVRSIHVGDFSGVVDVNPHNFYVQILVKLGLVGLLLILAAGSVLVRRYIYGAREQAAVAMSVLVATTALCATYPAPAEQGLILGALAAYAVHAKSRRMEHDADRDLCDNAQSKRQDGGFPRRTSAEREIRRR